MRACQYQVAAPGVRCGRHYRRADRASRSETDVRVALLVGQGVTLHFSADRIVGNGSFGVVYEAKVAETGEVVAIKKVLQDKRFKVRPRTRAHVCPSCARGRARLLWACYVLPLASESRGVRCTPSMGFTR